MHQLVAVARKVVKVSVRSPQGKLCFTYQEKGLELMF